jgi:PBP1b-binding outer membrane lipoprotein LpoB
MKKVLGISSIILLLAGCGVQPPPQLGTPPEPPAQKVDPNAIKKVTKTPVNKELVQTQSKIAVDKQIAKDIKQTGY